MCGLTGSHSLRPSPGYCGTAKFATAIFQLRLTQQITPPLYKHSSTVMAIGMAPLMSGHITQIYIMNPLLQGQIPKLL